MLSQWLGAGKPKLIGHFCRDIIGSVQLRIYG